MDTAASITPIGSSSARLVDRRYGRITYEESGNDIRAVQELLGHESSVTTQSYIFVPSSDLTFIARKVRARRPQDVSN